MATGNLTVRPWSIVTKILYDKDTKKATGVEVLDAENNKTYEYKAKIIFLNASTLNSAWILLNSATDIWPDGLGSSSGELGHNLMDHHLGIGAGGWVEGYEDKYIYGPGLTVSIYPAIVIFLATNETMFVALATRVAAVAKDGAATLPNILSVQSIKKR
jgi:choline dehydrogenase-like flavoprotein